MDRFVDGMNLQVYEYLMRAVLYHPSKKNKSLVNYNINTSWGLLVKDSMDVGDSVDADAVISDSDIDLFNNKPGDEDLNGEVQSYRYWKGPAKVKNPIQWWMDNKGVFPRLYKNAIKALSSDGASAAVEDRHCCQPFGATVPEPNSV